MFGDLITFGFVIWIVVLFVGNPARRVVRMAIGAVTGILLAGFFLFTELIASTISVAAIIAFVAIVAFLVITIRLIVRLIRQLLP